MIIIVNRLGKIIPLVKAEGMILDIDELGLDYLKMVEADHGKYEIENGQLVDHQN